MASDKATEFDWGALGESFWRELQQQVNANEQQLRFAVARHRGSNQTDAAAEAGYKGDRNALKGAGYKAERYNKVRMLLALAAAEKKPAGPGVMDEAEARLELSKVARGSDPGHKIRAIEALQRMDERASEVGRGNDSDGFSEWRWVRDMLSLPNGAAMVVYGWDGQNKSFASLPLLHDVYPACMRDAPEAWAAALKKQSNVMRAVLERHLADPEWQNRSEDHKPRQKIWREIGIDIGDTRPVSPQTENRQAMEIGGGDGSAGHDYAGDFAWEEEQRTAG